MRPPHDGGPLPELPPADERKALREKMGISIRTAAKDIGVSANTYSKWEKDLSTPVPANLRVYYSQLFGWQRAIDEVS